MGKGDWYRQRTRSPVTNLSLLHAGLATLSMDFLTFFVFVVRSSTDRLFDAVRIHVAGMEMTPGALLNLAVLGLAVLMISTRSGSNLTRPVSAFPFRAWLPFLLVAAVSLAWSPDKAAGVRALLVLLTYASFFAIPFFVRETFRCSAQLLKAIVYSSIVPVAAGMVELVFFRDPGGRIQSTFVHPNGFAFYLMVVLGLICFLLSSSTVRFTPTVRRLMVPYSAVLLGLLIMTQTRAAWAGTFLIIATYAIFINRRYLVVFLMLPLLIFVPAVGDRLADLGHGTAYTGAMGSRADKLNSFAWRTLLWESAIKDAADAPVLGKGLASFAPNSLKFFPLADTKKSYYRGGLGAHNAYVHIFYEMGAVGLLCYLAIYIGVFLRILRYFTTDPRGSIVLASTVLAYMTVNYSDNILDYGSVNMYFWGFVGIVFAKWAEQRSRYSILLRNRAAGEAWSV